MRPKTSVLAVFLSERVEKSIEVIKIIGGEEPLILILNHADF